MPYQKEDEIRAEKPAEHNSEHLHTDDISSESRPSPGRNPDDPLYVISVAAKLVGMPMWTLRVLDEQGIVSPKRTDKNRRLYSDRDLQRLTRVRTLTEDEGVNMNGVRLILKIEEERELLKGD